MLRIFQVKKDEDFTLVTTLFVEYADSLGFDLDFQDFEQECTHLAEHYAPPDGCLLLAIFQSQVAGCVAMRQFSDGICEMKRLYVKPEFRGQGIGRALAEVIIEKAQKAGYDFMRLDTIPSMQIARMLYTSLGFRGIEPYRYNPIEGAEFMELKLA